MQTESFQPWVILLKPCKYLRLAALYCTLFTVVVFMRLFVIHRGIAGDSNLKKIKFLK
jgi:hypothetical protein